MTNDISSLIDKDPAFLRDMKPDSDVQGYKRMQETRFNASRQETQDITLTTEEGDIVTISSNEQFKASYMSFDYSSQVNGKSKSAFKEEMSSSRENSFQISVEGELSEEEKEDIATILGQLDDIMEDLVSGDLEEVMKGAFGIMDDNDSIASLDAVLQFKQQISMEQRTSTRMTGRGNQLPPHHGHHGPPPAHAQGESPNRESILAGSNIIARLTGKIMDVIQQAPLDPKELSNSFDQMFKEIMDKIALNTEDPQNQIKAGLVDQLQANLDQLLETGTNNQPLEMAS